MNQIELINIHKYFGNQEIIKGIDLSVKKGEVLTFIGPSGGGKSTLLRCINLLENYEEGDILFNGTNIKNSRFSLKKYRQRVGMIFQQFNLFTNMTVLDNLMIGQVKVLGRSKEEATIKSREMLRKVGMEAYIKQSVNRLSGGQKQRVAIARTLAMDPEVILLDEPTSALDPQMVDEVLNVIRDLAKMGITLIIVTHEMRFAKEISDRIIFLKEGMLREEGTPDKIFTAPDSEEMQMFLKKYLEDRI